MIKNAADKSVVVDQYSDRSGAVLVKIAASLRNEKLAKKAVDTLFSLHEREQFCKAAALWPSRELFPVTSAEDVFLSRVYFEGQREKIAADEAERIEQRLAKYASLYNLPDMKIGFKKAAQTKTASQAHELLPQCNIASKSELFKAGEDFSREYDELKTNDRITFAKNFVKAAQELECADSLPEAVRIYAEEGVEMNPGLLDCVLMRKVAMERKGKGKSGYDTLYGDLQKCDLASLSADELHKIASSLEYADTMHKLRDGGHGKTIPDAWHSVFKVAMEDDTEIDASGMTRADIISRYGEGVLEEIEDGDGNIDRAKLARIMASLGDDKNKDSAT